MHRHLLAALFAVLVTAANTLAAQAPFDGLVLDVSSDACVTEAEAVEQAASRSQQLLQQELSRRTSLPMARLMLDIHRLTYSRDVERVEHTEAVQRPYGTLYRRHAQLKLSESAIQNWLSEIEVAEHSRWRRVWRTVASVVLSWLIVLRLFVVLDRRTRGYQRGWCATYCLTTGCLLTGGLCYWL
jgi:hypothetical protein